MNSLRKLFAALALTCALSIPAFAGDMGTQGIASSDTGTVVTDTQGDMGTQGGATPDPTTLVILGLLQSTLSLF